MTLPSKTPPSAFHRPGEAPAYIRQPRILGGFSLLCSSSCGPTTRGASSPSPSARQFWGRELSSYLHLVLPVGCFSHALRLSIAAFLRGESKFTLSYVSVHHQKTPGPLVTCTLCFRMAAKCPTSVFVSFVNAHQKRSVSFVSKNVMQFIFRLCHVR